MCAERMEAVGTSFFGKGAIQLLPQELKKRGGRRALIVTDKFLYESGMADTVGNVLLDSGLEYAIYYLVEPNPSVQIVNECIEAAKVLDVDWFVALGGGSAIDTAKAASIVLGNGGKVEDYEGKDKSKNPGIPIVAVNTTAGTGSEVTTFYIITDDKTHSKMCMVDTNCKVSIAINDIDFMMSMPAHLSAATGMDALTHGVEAILSKRATPFTDKDAYWALSTIQEYLPRAVANGGDEKAREMMAYAQYAAGVAFSNAGLGMVHAMAHALGGVYNLPHGVCNAVLLPYVLEFNGEHAKLSREFHAIAKTLGVSGAEEMSQKQNAVQVVQIIRELSDKLGIAKNLKMLGVEEKDFTMLADLALQDVCMADNRVFPNLQQVAKVYQNAYQGGTMS